VAVYEYDARMFRIGKLSYESGMAGDIRSFYFNAAWQCLEERVEPSSGSSSSGASTPLTDRQFIWGLRYIDDLILRDRDADSDSETGDLGKDDSGLEERLYSLQDPNWNVVAIGEPDGDIAERYTYTAYGQPEFRAPTFAGRQSSDCGWDYLCTGREYDAETGLYYYRARYYHPELGRFIGRDPIEYEGGSNLYEFVNDSPLTTVDPYGTQATRPLTPQEIAACCSNALAKQPPRAQATTRGWITCCKRQKLWCINLKLLPLPPRPTPSIPITAADFMRTTVRDCAIKHEQEHMRQTVSCDDPQWDQECLPFANRQMTMQYECGAYQREIYCLLESTAKVPTKMDLNQRLRYIQAIKVKAKDYAALANGQYKCNPPVSSARPKPTPRP